jgi:folate-binding protein YgfZ
MSVGTVAADPCFVRLGDRSVLALEGPGTVDFLQGLVSNDVARVAEDRAVYAALLTPQGKYLFDFLLLARGGTILLDTEAARLSELSRRLLMYRLRAKVEILDLSADHEVVAVVGGRAAACLGLADETGAARVADGMAMCVDPRLAGLGCRVVGPAEVVEAELSRLGLPAGDRRDLDQLRLGLGVPDGSRDLVPERSLLLESNFEELHGVDFDKGCYVGQELTARTKHRALVRKRLMPVRVVGPTPPPGSPIQAGERDAGDMRSACGDRGLALLRLEALAKSEGGALTCGEATLIPEPPPWMRL